MIIERAWAMPSKNTFEIKPIKDLLSEEVNLSGLWIDPFANRNKLASITNDLNPEYDTNYHLDALDFLKLFDNESVDGVLYDPPFCYDDKTYLFTQNGWKPIKEVSMDDSVATLNIMSDKLEWQKPTEVIHKPYNGQMVSIESQSISLLVTPNHRCFVKNSFYGSYHWVIAQDLFSRTNKQYFKKACSWDAPEKDYFILPEVQFVKSNRYGEKYKPAKKIPMEAWLKFLGLYLTEGSYSPARRKGGRYDYRIRISQIHPNVRQELEGIIKAIGFNYYSSDADYSIYDKQLWTYLQQFGYSYDKYIPAEIKALAPKQLQILIDYLIMGDGENVKYSKFNCTTQKYYPYSSKIFRTTSTRLRDDFCEVAIKCGYAISIHKPRQRDQKHAPVWSVKLLKAKSYSVRKEQCDKDVAFNGVVYCVSVPNATLLVMRKGRIFWCGNSPRQCSECYKSVGREVTSETTRASFWGNQKKEISRIVKPGGKVITFGWNSGGIGKTLGFEIKRILLVPHGGWHNDTICTVEVKTLKGDIGDIHV